MILRRTGGRRPTGRTGLIVLSLFLFCPVHTAQAGEDFSLGGFVLESLGTSGIRQSAVNPRNFLGIAPANQETALSLTGAGDGFTLRIRASENARYRTRVDSADRIQINELNKIFTLDDGLTLSIGKRLLTLDQSFVTQPLGFFQKQADLTDITDEQGRAQGLPMVVLTRVTDNASATLIYSNDFDTVPDGFNRGTRQIAFNYRQEFDDANASITIRKATGESVGLGLTGSATLSEALGVYGSFYAAAGTNRPILAALVGRPFSFNTIQAFGSFRANNSVVYPRFAAGATYTTEDQTTVMAEFGYDGRGLSGRQYQRFLNLIQFHRAGGGSPRTARLVAPNLATDSLTLRSLGAERTYLYLSVSRSLDDLTLSASSYLGLGDFSRTLTASASYRLTQRLEAVLTSTFIDGNTRSENRLSPVSDTVTTRLRYSF